MLDRTRCGALAAAIVWQIFQWVGAGNIGHIVQSTSATNSVFALVLGMLAFRFLVSSTLVLCAEINVVLVEQLYPRALLTPLTDAVDLTPADRKTYAKKAKAERVKGFQRVSVKFNDVNHEETPSE